MSGLEIAALGGLLLSGGGQVYGTISQANAARRNSELKNLQADELMSREKINEEIMLEQGMEAIDAYGAGQAGRGLGGGTLLHRTKLMSNLTQNIALAQRDAKFKEQMLRAGAEMDLGLSSDIILSGLARTGGSLLTGAGDLYALKNKYSKPSNVEPLY